MRGARVKNKIMFRHQASGLRAKNSHMKTFSRAINGDILKRIGNAMLFRIDLPFRAAAKQTVRRSALETAHAPSRSPMRGIFARIFALGLPPPFGVISIKGLLLHDA